MAERGSFEVSTIVPFTKLAWNVGSFSLPFPRSRTFQFADPPSPPFLILAGSIMTSYNSYDGVAQSASYLLLTEILRNEWDYQG